MAKVDYKIKWKQVDYMNLGRAIKRFNRTVRSLETDENQAFIPDYQNYQEMKETIKTRAELNRYMKSLSRFSKESNQKIIELESGEKITVWEKREIEKAAKRALQIVNENLRIETSPDETGYSPAQMGSLEKNRLEQQKSNIENWASKTGYNFHSNISAIKNLGRLDYDYRKAAIYMENYKDVMSKYSSYDNYQVLEKFLNRYSNPMSFWNRVKGNIILRDLTYQSDQYYTEQEFNEFLISELGIDSEELKNFDVQQYEQNLLKEEGIEI